ncbi:MAG: GNAT family N-acetyltransferase [Chloroflexi bacterium]|nr:GNAT family N-acetyltransferase [Chloroflexota bacterium]
MKLSTDFYTDRPQPDDIESVLTLMLACDVAEYGEPDTDLEDIEYDWDQADLNEDAWLIRHESDALAGYALVVERDDLFQLDMYIHPDFRGQDLNAFLLAQCLNRVQQRQPATPKPARIYAAAVNPEDCQTIEQAGFSVNIYHFRMQIEMTEPPPPPQFPDGSALRPIRPGQDERALYAFIKTGFDSPKRPFPSFDEWSGYMMRPDHYRLDLWFLLWHETEIIGAALCYDYELYGWVRQLAVAPGWRRQGIAANLLRYVFGVFYRQERLRIALGVHANNLGAVTLYERVGMQRVRQYNEYEK